MKLIDDTEFLDRFELAKLHECSPALINNIVKTFNEIKRYKEGKSYLYHKDAFQVVWNVVMNADDIIADMAIDSLKIFNFEYNKNLRIKKLKEITE